MNETKIEVMISPCCIEDDDGVFTTNFHILSLCAEGCEPIAHEVKTNDSGNAVVLPFGELEAMVKHLEIKIKLKQP